MSKNDSNIGDSANQYDGSHENPHNESGQYRKIINYCCVTQFFNLNISYYFFIIVILYCCFKTLY